MKTAPDRSPINFNDFYWMLVGDCRNEAMVEDIFGSVSNFALQVESCGDNFQYGPCKITYDEEKDIHNFYYHVFDCPLHERYEKQND